MSDYNTAEFESTDLEPRTERALTEYMTVLPLGGDIYSVTTQSGSEYHVDVRQERCTCPDDKHRKVRCKHQRRVDFAVGECTVPADMEEIDDMLGKHVDGSNHVTATDGGEVLNKDSVERREADYTYHVEPPEQGGARYVRCEGCGREVVPADPNLLTHPKWCPNSR